MITPFLSEDFLLETDSAKRLYHDHAEDMPIFDYHCHLPPEDIAINKSFTNLTEAWLAGDHYKWRAMRGNGIEESYITGSRSDEEKFMKWAETVPYTMRNPLYHWTHLELKRTFGIDDRLLKPETAKSIYDDANTILQSKQGSVRSLMEKMKVKAVCTTDDPCDSLDSHQQIKESGFAVKVLPTFRPDKAMAADDPTTYNEYLDRLSEVSGIDIKSYDDLLNAISNRHQYFHEKGCRLSDHGLETVFAEDFKQAELETNFKKVRSGEKLDEKAILQLKSALMLEFFRLNHEKNWTQQMHIGPIRNNNSRMFKSIGPDTGFDSIGDASYAQPLSKFLDTLASEDKLTRTIIYNINSRDNDIIATMIGNFQDSSEPSKIQFGSGWWHQDQKDGMEKQMNSLSTMGLLSRFVGMLTDSRSFLSYPRHEYFRRILCNLLGNDIENGELPADYDWIGSMVENICYNNAKSYFKIDLD